MTATVTIVDYGVGNLRSVARAFAEVGAEALVTSDTNAVADAARLVLPGVGAFSRTMAGLRDSAMVEPIVAHCRADRPFLGICVGMQMMMEESEEFGLHPGLGLLSGRVRAVPATGADGRVHKIPHIGWSRLMPGPGADWEKTPLSATRPGDSVYFVHSFSAHPDGDDTVVAVTDYDGCSIAAVIGAGRVFGCQFHPEKSGPVGLGILARFMEL